MRKSRQLKKPARHTRQSFDDQQAISLVSSWLAETKRAMPDLKANDKWPNIDGYIEITDECGYPKGTLKVQVKKLSKVNATKRQYIFKNDKFLSYCKESLDWIPILFIGVDLDKKKAFWLHMDQDFLNKTGGNKTIKFIESQTIRSGKNVYIQDWERIVALYNSKSKEFEKYKKAFSMLSDVVTPVLGRNDKKFINIHCFLDEVNHFLDSKFTIIKKIFYPKAWKLGLAYYQYKEAELVYTLYPITQSRNDVQIKEINEGFHNKIKKEGLGFIGYFQENPIEKRPKEYAKEVIKSKTLKAIEGKLFNHFGSKFLAREFIFTFIDKFHLQMGLEQKDKYLIEEIKNGFFRYLPLWLQESHNFLISENRNNFKERLRSGRIRYFDPDVITEIMENEREAITKTVEARLKENKSISSLPMGNKNLPFGLFVEFFNFLQQTEVEIERPYKEKDFLRLVKKGNWIWNVFSKQDVENNLKIFFRNLPRVYSNFVESNFPLLKNELSLFSNADVIAVSWVLKEKYLNYQSRPTYEMYYLKSEDKEDSNELVISITTKEAELLQNLDFSSREVNFRGKRYKIKSRIISVLDFIYEDTPMLNFIYKLIESRLKNYFNYTDGLE